MCTVPLFCTRNKQMNQINYIRPYLHDGLWVFDDKDKGLNKEALVGGTELVIGMACQDYKIKNPEKGFGILFSHTPFKNYQFSLKWLLGDENGNTYEYLSKENGPITGWLCNALLKYFSSPPKEIFIQLRSIV